MSIALPLESMTVGEKLDAMEAIWDSLARNPDAFESPAWHADVLREREREVEAGKTDFIPWEEAQREIDRMVALRLTSDAAK